MRRFVPDICRRRTQAWLRPRCSVPSNESLVGPLAAENMDDPGKLRDAVQTVTLLALRAVGVMDARARGLVVQAVLPAKTLVGA